MVEAGAMTFLTLLQFRLKIFSVRISKDPVTLNMHVLSRFIHLVMGFLIYYMALSRTGHVSVFSRILRRCRLSCYGSVQSKCIRNRTIRCISEFHS